MISSDTQNYPVPLPAKVGRTTRKPKAWGKDCPPGWVERGWKVALRDVSAEQDDLLRLHCDVAHFSANWLAGWHKTRERELRELSGDEKAYVPAEEVAQRIRDWTHRKREDWAEYAPHIGREPEDIDRCYARAATCAHQNVRQGLSNHIRYKTKLAQGKIKWSPNSQVSAPTPIKKHRRKPSFVLAQSNEEAYPMVVGKELRPGKDIGVLRMTEAIPSGWIVRRITMSWEKGAGRWMASFSVMRPQRRQELVEGLAVGVDVGVRYVATVHNSGTGQVDGYLARKKSDELGKQIRRVKRKISRCIEQAKLDGRADSEGRFVKGEDGKPLYSRRHWTLLDALGRLEWRARCRLNDNIHQVSSSIRDLGPERAGFETLRLRDMSSRGGSRKRGMNRGMREAGIGKFSSEAEAKLCEVGTEIVKHDPFFPSTKGCSECGEGRNVSNDYWKFVCGACGWVCHREANAARNLTPTSSVGERQAAGHADNLASLREVKCPTRKRKTGSAQDGSKSSDVEVYPISENLTPNRPLGKKDISAAAAG